MCIKTLIGTLKLLHLQKKAINEILSKKNSRIFKR